MNVRSELTKIIHNLKTESKCLVLYFSVTSCFCISMHELMLRVKNTELAYGKKRK